MDARAEEQLKLRCLGGAEAPADLLDDCAELVAPAKASASALAQLVLDSLGDGPDDALLAALEAFCSAHGASVDGVARGLKACRFLVTRAAAMGLAQEAFEDDARVISERAGFDLTALLAPVYARVLEPLRRRALARTLADHGALLEHVAWRVDELRESSHGGAFAMPVGLLTLRYREGGRSETVTLYVPPAMARALREACDSLPV